VENLEDHPLEILHLTNAATDAFVIFAREFNAMSRIYMLTMTAAQCVDLTKEKKMHGYLLDNLWRASLIATFSGRLLRDGTGTQPV
jgi:hypothetical protein